MRPCVLMLLSLAIVQIGPDDNWVNPKKSIRRGSTISKRSLSSDKQYQVRVRGRLKACTCGVPADEERGYLRCASTFAACECRSTFYMIVERQVVGGEQHQGCRKRAIAFVQ